MRAPSRASRNARRWQIDAWNAAAYESTTNLLTDGDCEASGVTAWTTGGSGIVVTKETDARPNSPGTKCLKLTHASTTACWVYQSVLTKGRMYRVRFWYKTEGGTSVLNDGALTTGISLTSTSWAYVDEYIIPSGAYVAWKRPSVAGAALYLDDLSIVLCSESAFPDLTTTANCTVQGNAYDGTLRSFGVNAPRFNQTGLRNHPAATDMITNCDVCGGGSVSGIARTLYEGRGSHLLIETAQNGEHKVAKTSAATLADSTAYTVTVFAKAIGARSLRVTVTTANLVPTSYSQDFTLSTTEYTKCSFSFTTVVGDAGACTVTLNMLNDGASSYVGKTACGAYVSQFMTLEVGTVSTPDTYTYGATASSVAPLYNVTQPGARANVRGVRFEPEIEFQLYEVTNGRTYYLWSVVNSDGTWCELQYIHNWSEGVDTSVFRFKWDGDEIDIDTGRIKASYIYKLRAEIFWDSSRMAVRLVAINLTDDELAFDASASYAGPSPYAQPDTLATVYMGADHSGASQFNYDFVEFGT